MVEKTKDSIKVAYILHYFPVLSETFVFDEIIWLKKTGVDIKIFAFDSRQFPLMHREGKELAEETNYAVNPKAGIGSFSRVLWENFLFFLSSPVKFIRYFCGYFFKIGKKEFSQIFFLGALIKKYKPDYLHAHFAYLSAASAMIISDFIKVPFIVTVHARDMFVANSYLEDVLRRAKYVIVKSDYNKKYIMNKYSWLSADKVKTIPCGVDAGQFIPGEKLARSGTEIISVGRLVEKKGFTYLIKACKILQQKGLEFKCEIYGDGPLKDELLSEIKNLGLSQAVFLRGVISRDELINVLKRSDIFVLPSIVDSQGDTEAMPVVLKEAMAAARAVVASDAAGIPELIDSGETGILVPSKNEKALAEAIIVLAGDKNMQLRLGRNAREKIIRDFTLSKSAETIKVLFVE
ncbi:MAG: glycosyltransferase [Candidatus Omnitrophica bacterium]|nr:glycosyltransferase [Candidatus Omnitrophota bacterium]